MLESNDWGDDDWGVCNGVGANLLGVLLMERRGVIQPLEPEPRVRANVDISERDDADVANDSGYLLDNQQAEAGTRFGALAALFN
ncbi:hypothetical protein JNW87_31675, partial [Micromonospora sp. ATA51]